MRVVRSAGVRAGHFAAAGRQQRAKVAELVDARDLGSRGLWPWGFESPLSHFRFTRIRGIILAEHR